MGYNYVYRQIFPRKIFLFERYLYTNVLGRICKYFKAIAWYPRSHALTPFSPSQGNLYRLDSCLNQERENKIVAASQGLDLFTPTRSQLKLNASSQHSYLSNFRSLYMTLLNFNKCFSQSYLTFSTTQHAEIMHILLTAYH